MTQPQDPRKHPLQDDEIALARVLRALPAGDPPASVDAAILRAATDAVAPGRRKPPAGLRWLPTWAIGTAAAAVLAVGIGLQLRPPLQPESAPASASEAAKPLPPARERLSVDLVEPDQAVPPPAAPPPSLQRPARGVPAPPPPPAPPTPREPEAFPVPQAAAPAPEPAAEMADPGVTMDAVAPAAVVEESESRLRSEDNDQARRLHQEAFARRAQAKASAQAQAREESAASGAAAASGALNESAPVAPAAMAAPAPAPAAPASAEAMADVVGQAAILPPVADDARLAPDAWLDRVRERRRQGDAAGARASLRLFLKAHPDAPIPSDLASLR